MEEEEDEKKQHMYNEQERDERARADEVDKHT